MGLRVPRKTAMALRALFTAAVLAWVWDYLRENGAGMRPPEGSDWICIALGLLTIPLSIGVRAGKWATIARLAEPDVTWREAAASYLGSLPLGMMTPGRMGEFSRFLYFRHRSLKGWASSGLVVLDKYTDLLAVTAWAAPGLAVLLGFPGLLLDLAGVSVLLLVPALLARLGSRLPADAPGIRSLLGKALPSPSHASLPRLAGPIALGLLGYAVEWIQFTLMLDAFSTAPIPYLPLAGLSAVIILGNALQVTVGGIGVREGLAMVLLAPFGIGPEAAVPAAFAWFVLGQLLPAAAGLAIRPHALYGPAPAEVAGPPAAGSRAAGKPG